MQYQDIIHISNDIRFILDTSRQAHLAAINAALAARRAGNVKGFEAVAGELKSFSLRLTTAMDEMAIHILAVSQAVSNLYRQRHSLRNHEGAYRLSQGSGHGAIVAREKARQHSLNEMLLGQVNRLVFFVIRALRLCLTGRNLARSAMVEAAYGSEASGMLKNVASAIEATVDSIYGRLKAIHQRIQ